MSDSWQLDGEYFESCNCELLCPCLLVKGSKPTEGHCDVVVAFHIKSGKYGSTDLSGLSAVTVIYTPGIMTEGKWTMGSYVDERANGAQRAALEKIFTAQAGGPLSRFAPLVAHRLPARPAAISFASEGNTRKLSIKGVTEVTVQGVAGANGEQVWFDNVAHFASKRLAAAKATASHFKDQGLSSKHGPQRTLLRYSLVERVALIGRRRGAQTYRRENERLLSARVTSGCFCVTRTPAFPAAPTLVESIDAIAATCRLR